MRCAAITSAGGRCKLEATHGSYCYSHAPETAEERRRRASRGGKAGGRGRGPGELAGIKAQLEDLARAVLEGDQETGRAAVANQLINTRLRAIEQERKNRETQELAGRVEELERRLSANQQKGRRAW